MLWVGCGHGCVLILFMLYIKQSFPSKHNDIYISSIKLKFDHKNSKHLRMVTDPLQESSSPALGRILSKYETIDLQPSLEQSKVSKLAVIDGLQPRQDCQEHRKRWREIERDQYDSIKQQIRVSRSISHPPRQHFLKKGPAFPFHPRNHILQSPSKPQALKEKAQGSCWIEHIKAASNNRRQSFIQRNSGYLFPEVVVKLPRIATYQGEGDLSLVRSLALKSNKEEDIFCSRDQKRSEIKLRAQRAGDAARRRRWFTIGEGGQGRIQPWRQVTVISKSFF